MLALGALRPAAAGSKWAVGKVSEASSLRLILKKQSEDASSLSVRTRLGRSPVWATREGVTFSVESYWSTRRDRAPDALDSLLGKN